MKNLDEVREKICSYITEKILLKEYGPEKYEAYIRSGTYKFFNEDRKDLIAGTSMAFDEAVKLKDEEWRKVVEPLVEALKKVNRHGLTHYEECPSNIEDNECDCGSDEVGEFIEKALEYFEKNSSRIYNLWRENYIEKEKIDIPDLIKLIEHLKGAYLSCDYVGVMGWSDKALTRLKDL